jgi:hypothetical protein
MRDAVLAVIAANPDPQPTSADPVFVENIARSILEDPDEEVHAYLARLGDTYVLFSFLRETPDVQSVAAKMFGYGEIWLDSSIVLPLLADTLEEDEHRHFSALVAGARGAGMDLFVTRGCIEEVERHLNRVLICSRTPSAQWRGDYPYLFARYLDSGRSLGRVSNWLETFIGQHRREEDLVMYLSDAHSIEVRDFAGVDVADPDLWRSSLGYWQRIHEGRRSKRSDYDAILTMRLAKHDAETHVGILNLRRGQAASPLGYKAWWLTLDRGAMDAHREVARELRRRDYPAPVMSPDFLRNYLAFGPSRRLVPTTLEAAMPVVADVQLSRYVPPELVEVARETRESNRGQPERVIRRRVRDALDAARARRGPLAQGGLQQLKERLRDNE